MIVSPAAKFSDLLGRKRVALVYSFRAPNEPSDRWYDRWKTRVIMSYGEALERIGVYPYYCDIDTFCAQSFSGALPQIDAVISLNAGVRPVSHFALVPAVANWKRLPIIPCTADTVIAGERKDLANLVASRCGVKVPETFSIQELGSAQSESKLITKPRDLGGSVGVKAKFGIEISAEDFDKGRIVQKFIKGTDVTIPIFFHAPSEKLCVGDATLYFPDVDQPGDWIYDREAKEAYVTGGAPQKVERRQIPVSPELASLLVRLAGALGIDCFARMDFRLARDDAADCKCLVSDDLYFVEVNPMPTVCAGLAFVDSVRSWLSRTPLALEGLSRNGLAIGDDYDVIAFVLANALLRMLHPAEMNDRNQIGS